MDYAKFITKFRENNPEIKMGDYSDKPKQDEEDNTTCYDLVCEMKRKRHCLSYRYHGDGGIVN